MARRNFSVKRVGPWAPVIALLQSRRRLERALESAIARESFLWAREMKLFIIRGSGEHEQLSKITVHLKSFFGLKTKPLIAYGDMVNSIRSHRLRRGYYMAGILRTAIGSRGRSMADVAEMMEFGSQSSIVQVVESEKQINFFWRLRQAGLMAFVPQKGSVVRINIRERRFARPVAEELAPKAQERMVKRVAEGFIPGNLNRKWIGKKF